MGIIMAYAKNLEIASRQHIAGWRKFSMTSAQVFAMFILLNIILDVFMFSWLSLAANLISIVGSMIFAYSIFYCHIFRDSRRLWMLYTGTPVELDYMNGDRVKAWLLTLTPTEYYFHMGGFVVVFKDPGNAALVRLMVD